MSITDNGGYPLPKGIVFEQQGKTLILRLSEKGLTTNMQNNACAFEGWAICLYANNPGVYDKIRIEWKPVSEFGDTPIRPNSKHGHYYRFLYRALQFKKNHPTIVEIAPSIDNAINVGEFRDWVLNYPKDKIQLSQKNNKNAEAHLERSLLKMMSSHFDYCDEQLPVGLFYKEVCEANSRTTGHQSQIDLWSVKNGILSIYELKNDVNVSVGIISELMFYVNVMNDLRLHTFNYPESVLSQKTDYRNSRKFAEDIANSRIHAVEGILLANNLHPRITPEVIDFMNKNKAGIKYSHITVNEFIKTLS